MESDDNISCLGARKYKTAAVEKLHTSINNIVLEARFKKYNLPLYVKGLNETYRVLNVKEKRENQTIQYTSFDDANGIAGTEAPNLTYFGLVAVDEPVLFNDEGKLPTRKEWKDTIKLIEDTIDRTNRRYANLHKKEIMNTKYHFMMNA
ncbi:hypothetical protein [Cetobacterium sp.]|uniref:hypothetical protein n=1 Tax=Cetobacterium sp. TaxID=2071632 RepID=UPI003F2E3C31